MRMRVLIVDDHPLYREEVARQIVRFYPGATVAEAASLTQTMALARAVHPRLFILNYDMPGMSAEAVATVAGEFSGAPILVVADQASVLEVQALIRAGAHGYLSKTATREQLTHTIHLLLAGGTSVPADLLFANDALERPPAWLSTLTPRETDVLRAATRGLSNKEIARELELAEVTVKFHLSAIFRKMKARSRTEAAMLATRAGIG